MHFKFRAHPRGGVRVIEEITNFSLCWLEGRNGVGKTLAVRLLELATGGQPYLGNTAAWQSLRENLGYTEITVTELKGGGRLELQLTPERWPSEPDPDIDPEVIGTARLDGEEYTFGAVSELLRVFRIAGDDSITDRFRTMIQTDQYLVNRHNQRLEAAINPLVISISRLLSDIGELSVHNLNKLEAKQREVSYQREEAARQFQQDTQLIEDLEMLRRLGTALRELEEREPNLEAALLHVEDAVSTVEQERTQLEERQRELLPQAEQRESLLERLTDLRRQRENHAERAEDAMAKTVQILNGMGLPPLDREQLKEAQEDAELTRETLIENRASLAISPNLTRLVNRVLDPLEEIRGSPLNDEIIAVVRETRLKVEELRDGLSAREREIALNQQGSLVEELDARVADLNSKLESIEQAKKHLKAYRYQSTRLTTVESEISQLSESLAANVGDDYKDVVNILKGKEEEYIELLQRRVELRHKKGLLRREGSADELKTRIAELRSELKVTADGQETAEQKVRAEFEERRAQLRIATDELDRVKADLDDFNSGLADTLRLFELSPQYEWLRSSIEANYLPRTGLEPRACLQRLERICSAAQDLQDTVDKLANTVPAVDAALGDLSRNVGKSNDPGNRYVRPLAGYYETRLGYLLSAPEIEKALFQGGRFAGLDLLQGVVSWRDGSGDPRRRPIEAFSSGEQAFAYVLASVLQRADETASNRVLVLDEFGAFIEAGRLDRLLRFLNQRVLKAEHAEQVIIILPLRQPLEQASIMLAESGQTEVRRDYFMQERYSS